MDARKLRHLIEYAVFLLFLFVLKCLPVRSTVRLANWLGWLAYRVAPRKVNRSELIAANYRAAFGEHLSDEEVNRATLGMWQHLARMVFEIIQLERRFRLYNCTDVLRFHQRDECVQAVLSGRPVLMLSGHFGNWEISVNTFGYFGLPMGVVARDLDNPWLHRWFLRFRESTGNSMISKQGASSELVKVMEAAGSASLLCDQDAGRRGVFVDFFGKPASTFKSIALLALQYDAMVVVGGTWRLPHAEQYGSRWVNFELATEAVLDSRDFNDADGINRLTQSFTSALEALVRRAPNQYFWVHRRWKTAPRVRKTNETKRAA